MRRPPLDHRIQRMPVLLVVLTLVLAVVAAACGGGGSSSSSTGSTEAASSTEGGGSTGNLGAVEAFVAEAEAEPTEIPAQTPLQAEPQPGETMIYLNSDIPQSQQVADGLKQAAESVGWKYEQINFKAADVSTLVKALEEALERKPLAVTFGVGPEATWQQLRPAYEKAGVGMIPLLIGPAKETEPVWGNIGAGPQNEWIGKVLADWMIVNSGGKGTAVLQAIPAFSAVTEWVEAFEKEVSENCPGCTVKQVETSIAEATGGTAGATLTSALQSDGGEYAFVYNGAFIPGAKAELETAGLGDVKLGGWSVTSEFITDEINGSDYAWLAPNTRYAGWLAVDYALRHLDGKELSPEETLVPAQLITKENATPELAESVDDFTLPKNYGQQFEELWLVK